MSKIKITAGPFVFVGELQLEKAPQTCAAFLTLLPYEQKLIQARWSGESAWIPLGEMEVGVGEENQTSHPAPGEILLYPKGVSETEILFPYGQTVFASKFGRLEGNSFLILTQGQENLGALGELVLWKGAQNIRFEKMN